MNYKVSEETRRKLIHVAGELFARRGTEAVTVREITKNAGMKPNAISYHFGGKEGLIEAIWDYALQRWEDHRMERYCVQNDYLFASRDGQRQLVIDVINIFYEKLYEEEQPLWVNLFLLRSFITAREIERTRRVFGEQLLDILCHIFQRITGNEDRITGTCWALNIISPGSYLAASATDFLHFTSTDKIDYAFCRRLQATVTRNALFALGLAEDAP